MKLYLSLFLLLVLTAAVNGHSATEWKSRVIYQLLTDRFAKDSDVSDSCSDLNTYCGGTFKGITRKLDYIQDLGVNAIWISPIPKQTDNGYHGYWQQDITEINSYFGSSDDLKQLVKECHNRDIWVMLDVVGNHMGTQNNGDWYNFAKFTPFNQREYYHDYCLITDFSNQSMVEYCRLANLPDLDQNNDFVHSTLKSWIHDTVQTYGFDGLRVDTTPEVHPDFWSEYSTSSGVFTIGEVFNGNPEYCSRYQGCLSSVLNYPMYYKLKDSFQGRKSMYSIHDGIEANSVFQDASVLGSFLDNHDNPRFLSQNSDQNVLLSAMAYNIFAQGIPIIYYGTEQGFKGSNDPYNRESLWPHYDTTNTLYTSIATMAKFRIKLGSALYNSPQVQRYVDDQFFAFTRGKVFVATSNIGSGQSMTRTITYHPYSDGIRLVNQLNSNDTVTVKSGQFQVYIQNGLPKVYYPSSELQPDDEMMLHDDNNKQTSNSVKISVSVSVVMVIVLGTVIIIVGSVLLTWRRKMKKYSSLK